MRISEHFALSEFVKGKVAVPGTVLANIYQIATTILEPVREHFGVPVHIHSGWRPPERNQAVGGVAASDHLTGRAVDFSVGESLDATWEENTIVAYAWLRENKAGTFGQLILEDHRFYFNLPGKLWVHAALKSAKHSGNTGDRNRLLVSHEPGKYEPWQEVVA